MMKSMIQRAALHCVIQDMIHYEINDEKYDPESSIC